MNGIGELIQGYRGAKILFAAARLGLFEKLGAGRRDSKYLAQSMDCDPRATGILLDALCSMEYLSKSRSGYAVAPRARRWLVPGGPQYLGDNLRYQDELWTAWSDLGGVLRRGGPRRDLRSWIVRGSFGPSYIRGMDNIGRGPARFLADNIPLRPGSTILDVGAGPGTYAAAFLRRYPEASAVLMDLPSTLAHARRLLAGQPSSMLRRVRLKPGDYHRTDFGRSCFDLVIFSHVTHDEGEMENRRLLRKAFHALRPGARVVIHDFMVNSARTAPLFGALFSVHMLVYTRKGRVYSEREYARWLRGAGFRGLHRLEVPSNSVNSTIGLCAVRPAG